MDGFLHSSNSVYVVWIVFFASMHMLVILRALSADGRDPSARAAWVLALILFPIIGVLAYLLIGEPWLTRRVRRSAVRVANRLDAMVQAAKSGVLISSGLPENFVAAFRCCEALARCATSAGNVAHLAADSNAAIDTIVADIDAAQDSVHLSFYIWLADHNGLRVAEAVMCAARRGVACRVVADGIGSRALIHSAHWEAMRSAGVQLCESLRVPRFFLPVLDNRVDLRNHRKIVVIDGTITYVGSQNCADPEFLIKAKFAPWVDIMLRIEGPVAQQNQLLFLGDWMAETGEDLTGMLSGRVPQAHTDGVSMIAFGTGPLSPRGSMSDVFACVLAGARSEVVISTPYFVPDLPLFSALICCARRGVVTTLILPARNDSWAVAAISKAHYFDMLDAGIRVFEFHGGLLHAKTLVADGCVTLIGSANMDRRSLSLNFENNILLHSEDLSGAIRERQNQYLASATEVRRVDVPRSLRRRLGESVVTLFSPLL